MKHITLNVLLLMTTLAVTTSCGNETAEIAKEEKTTNESTGIEEEKPMKSEPAEAMPFIGKWVNKERTALLDIEEKGEHFQIDWKTQTDMFMGKSFELGLVEGKLILEEENQKISIEYKTENSIEIYMDDNPEFDPIMVTLLPTESTDVDKGM